MSRHLARARKFQKTLSGTYLPECWVARVKEGGKERIGLSELCNTQDFCKVCFRCFFIHFNNYFIRQGKNYSFLSFRQVFDLYRLIKLKALEKQGIHFHSYFVPCLAILGRTIFFPLYISLSILKSFFI